MKIISLGGVGGCQLASALRIRNYETYPYDWLITSQSFILNSFNNIDNFFTFDHSYVYQNVKLLCKDRNAVMLHDFTNFENQKTDVIEKYKRRFNRLSETLKNVDRILFVRVMENLQESLYPLNFYDDIFLREEENITIWEEFIQNIKEKYKCDCHLLLITNEKKYLNKSEIYKDVTISYTLDKLDNDINLLIDHVISNNWS